jgi:ATPase subunit of ABC transporter with duplicated ATPase domains
VRSTQHEQEHGSQDEYGSQEKKEKREKNEKIEKIEKIDKKEKRGTISEGNRRNSPVPPVYPQNLLNVSHMHVECDGLDLIQWHLSESVSEARSFLYAIR